MPKKESPYPSYLGGSAFPDGEPVCKPIVPGRTIKPIGGPVHPGFKGKPPAPKRPAPPSHVIIRSNKTDEVYERPKRKR